MSNIGSNIRKIRGVKGLSQAAFAELFDLARASVGAYEEGRAEPKVDKIIEIARHFGISVDALLVHELTVNEIQDFSGFQKGESKHAVRHHLETSTPFVSMASQLEYIIKGKSHKYISSLPQLRFPIKTREKYLRAFQCKGNAMEYNGKGVFHGDVLQCSKKEFKEINKKCLGKIFILVMSSQIEVRRLCTSNKILAFLPDNPSYSTVQTKDSNIREIWEAFGIYSKKLQPRNSLEERVYELEKLIRKVSDINEKQS